MLGIDSTNITNDLKRLCIWTLKAIIKTLKSIKFFFLTVCKRQRFSRRDPTQPQKVMMNMRTPTINSITAGSTARHASAVSKAEGEREDTQRITQTERAGWETFLEI